MLKQVKQVRFGDTWVTLYEGGYCSCDEVLYNSTREMAGFRRWDYEALMATIDGSK